MTHSESELGSLFLQVQADQALLVSGEQMPPGQGGSCPGPGSQQPINFSCFHITFACRFDNTKGAVFTEANQVALGRDHCAAARFASRPHELAGCQIEASQCANSKVTMATEEQVIDHDWCCEQRLQAAGIPVFFGTPAFVGSINGEQGRATAVR